MIISRPKTAEQTSMIKKAMQSMDSDDRQGQSYGDKKVESIHKSFKAARFFRGGTQPRKNNETLKTEENLRRSYPTSH